MVGAGSWRTRHEARFRFKQDKTVGERLIKEAQASSEAEQFAAR